MTGPTRDGGIKRLRANDNGGQRQLPRARISVQNDPAHGRHTKESGRVLRTLKEGYTTSTDADGATIAGCIAACRHVSLPGLQNVGSTMRVRAQPSTANAKPLRRCQASNMQTRRVAPGPKMGTRRWAGDRRSALRLNKRRARGLCGSGGLQNQADVAANDGRCGCFACRPRRLDCKGRTSIASQVYLHHPR